MSNPSIISDEKLECDCGNHNIKTILSTDDGHLYVDYNCSCGKSWTNVFKMEFKYCLPSDNRDNSDTE